MRWQAQVKSRTQVGGAATELGFEFGRMNTLGPCPCCNAERRGSEDRRKPIGMRRDGLGWHCHVCGKGGDVVDLIAATVLGDVGRGLPPSDWQAVRARAAGLGWCDPESGAAKHHATREAPKQIVRRKGLNRGGKPRAERRGGGGISWSPGLASECAARLWTDEGAAVLEYARSRGLSDGTIREFQLGAIVDEKAAWLVVPLHDRTGTIVNIKARRLPDADGKTARPKYRTCSGRPMPLFGVHRLAPDLGTEPVIVEGEIDAISLYEYGVTENVVTSTAGAGTFTEEWLDQLEPFSGFILAFDDDEAGEKGRKELAEKLGPYRCSIAKLPGPDVNACLMAGVSGDNIEHALNASQPMVGVEIVNIADIAPELEAQIEHPEALIGRPTSSDKMDAAIAGIRPGLVVVSGETGEGKTTFLTWLLLNQARLGVPSLLTAMEQSPVGLLQKAVRSELGLDFTTVGKDKRTAAYGSLSRLPIDVLKRRGTLSPGELVNSIRYARRRLGTVNFLIDHLGFIRDDDFDETKERQAIESVVRELSILGEHEGCTIFLVVHPSNADNARRKRVLPRHLKGASAIRQDAHEIWVVEKAKPTKKRPYPGSWIHFDKVRSDFASSGSKVFLAFDPIATVFADSWGETPSGRRGIRMSLEASVPKEAIKRSKEASSGALLDSESDDNDT